MMEWVDVSWHGMLYIVVVRTDPLHRWILRCGDAATRAQGSPGGPGARVGQACAATSSRKEASTCRILATRAGRDLIYGGWLYLGLWIVYT